MVATQEVSDIPHTSQMRMPSASKNSSTSTGVGAAPMTNHSAWSRPSCARIRRAVWRPGVTPLASRPALTFSQTRGTAPNHVGWTWATTPIRSGSEATLVTVLP